jgi:pimeloyl-ACP methyl ester carboxylesterase
MPFVVVAGMRLEYERVAGSRADQPTLVILHEGLGSVAMWRDFPARLAAATGSPVMLYSRAGYGRSERLKGARTVRYMHQEALVVLPELLDTLGVAHPILFGHSDGASIALIHASGHLRPVKGVIAVAPHVFVENLSVESIAQAKRAYEATDLRKRLARYHEDVDGAFWGWNDIWLHPEFRSWSIEKYLADIECPILAIQGEQDEYGTMEQVDRIARAAREVELVKLPDCRHSPHRDQPAAMLGSVARWMRRLNLSGDSEGLP